VSEENHKEIYQMYLRKPQLHDFLFYKHYRNTYPQGSKLLQNQDTDNTG